MVRGITKRVVVVKSPDPKMFEEAIFIVRDDYLESPEASSKELLRQAELIASSFGGNQKPPSSFSMKKKRRKFPRGFPVPFFVAAGVALSGMAALAMQIV